MDYIYYVLYNINKLDPWQPSWLAVARSISWRTSLKSVNLSSLWLKTAYSSGPGIFIICKINGLIIVLLWLPVYEPNFPDIIFSMANKLTDESQYQFHAVENLFRQNFQEQKTCLQIGSLPPQSIQKLCPLFVINFSHLQKRPGGQNA